MRTTHKLHPKKI